MTLEVPLQLFVCAICRRRGTVPNEFTGRGAGLTQRNVTARSEKKTMKSARRSTHPRSPHRLFIPARSMAADNHQWIGGGALVALQSRRPTAGSARDPVRPAAHHALLPCSTMKPRGPRPFPARLSVRRLARRGSLERIGDDDRQVVSRGSLRLNDGRPLHSFPTRLT
jgi:hypothetical protein